MSDGEKLSANSEPRNNEWESLNNYYPQMEGETDEAYKERLDKMNKIAEETEAQYDNAKAEADKAAAEAAEAQAQADYENSEIGKYEAMLRKKIKSEDNPEGVYTEEEVNRMVEERQRGAYDAAAWEAKQDDPENFERWKEEHPFVIRHLGKTAAEMAGVEEASGEAQAETEQKPEREKTLFDEAENKSAAGVQAEIESRCKQAREDLVTGKIGQDEYDARIKELEEKAAPWNVPALNKVAEDTEGGDDLGVALEAWKGKLDEMRAQAQEELDEGLIEQAEYEERMKYYEKELADNEETYERFVKKEENAGEDTAEMGAEDVDDIELKVNLKNKVKEKGELLEADSEKSGIKKGLAGWFERVKGKAKAATLRAKLIAAGLIIGATAMAAGGPLLGDKAADKLAQVSPTAINVMDKEDYKTPETTPTAINAQEKADSDAEKDKERLTVKYNIMGEDGDFSFEYAPKDDYNPETREYNSDDKRSDVNITPELYDYDESKGPEITAEQAAEITENLVKYTQNEPLMAAHAELFREGVTTGFTSQAAYNERINMMHNDAEGVQAYLNDNAQWLAEYINGSTMHYHLRQNNYGSDYGTRIGDDLLANPTVNMQDHVDNVEFMVIDFEKDGEWLANNDNAKEAVRQLWGIGDNVDFRLGISPLCGQIVIEWMNNGKITYAEETTPEQTQQIMTQVTPTPETPSPTPETPPPTPETPSPTPETPPETPPVLQPKGPNPNDGGNNIPMGPTEVIPEAIEATPDNQVTPDVQPGDQVMDVITDNPEIAPTNDTWQPNTPPEQGAPVIPEAAPVENLAAPESAAPDTAPSTDQQLAEQFGDRF